MTNPCLKLIKGNNALETHFAGIEKLPIEQQREAILNKAKEYHEILYNELEALKITINPNHKVIKFSPDGKKETPVDEANPEQTDNKLKINVVPNGNTAFDKQAQKFINAYLELKSKYKLKQKAFVNFAIKNFGVNSKNKNYDVFTLVDLKNNKLYHFKSIKDLYQGALNLDLEEFHIVRENRKDNVVNYDYTVGTLFGDTDFEFYDENGNLKEQVKNDAISIIEKYFNPTKEVKETPKTEPKIPLSEKSTEQEIFDFVNNDLENKKETSSNGNTFVSGEKNGVKYDIQQNSEGNWRVTRIIDEKGNRLYDLAEYKELATNDKFPKEEELSNVAAELKEVDKRIQDFEKDPDEEELEFEEKPQDNKIRIGDVVYPNFNEDLDVSIVEGKNLKTNEANYLVKINKQLDYQSEYKKVVEPLFLKNGGEWNKSHKAIIFTDKAKAQFVVNEVSRRLYLQNDNQNIVNEPNADYQKNTTLALNTTNDGQEFLSLSEPGSEYSNSSQPNLWQQGDTVSNNNNRRSVRAIWTKYENLQFKGTTKVKNAEDVAQIMSLLENKAVEHAFAIHIDKDGNSHIQFLSIGGVTGTVVDKNIIAAGVAKFNSKKVYLVHNHPSGRMIPSDADLQVTKTLRDGLNPIGVTVEHVIMDTYLKEYIHIDNDNLFTKNTRGENTFKTTLTPIALTEQEILGNHFGKVLDSDTAFGIIQNFRFSAFPKNAMLVLNNSNEVIGNYVFSNGDITYEEVLNFVGETATARNVIFYGNQANNLSDVKDFQRGLNKLSITVLDKIVTSSDNEAVKGYYESMSDSNKLHKHHEQYSTGSKKFNEVNEPSSSYNKNLRLPQTIARQALDQIKEDKRNNIPTKDLFKNAVSLIKNSDWYNDLDSTQQAKVNNTTIKSLLENAIKELNYLEDKIEDYKQQLKENKLTARQVFDDIIAFLKTNQIKGRITPTEINRLIKTAAQITIKRDTEKALDDFMNLYEVVKEKALLRSDKGAQEKAEVEYVVPIVEMLVESGYDLDMVLDYFETNSQKRMAEIQYHKEKSKFATEEERVNKAEEALKKQKQDLFNATYTSFREGLKKARLYWFNFIADRSYVPAELMSKTGMQQTYYQFKNTKGYGHNAKQMYEKVYDKVWKGLSQDKIQLLHDAIQMMRIITIDNNREQNGLSPVQHPNNLSKIDAQSWLDNQKIVLGEKEFNDIQKRAKEYFKAYTEVLDLKMENGFISDETYEALNGLDYQPRMFLHHAVNFDGDLSFEQVRSIKTRSGLSKEQVLKLDDGSANSLISDAQWLLSNSISTLYQDIADNNLNKLFIAKEFPIAQAKYEELLEKAELTKEEQRFVKYFKELSKKVISNDIIGFNSSTNDPIYKNEAPKHFVNKYYWDNGVKHQFFMEEKLATEFEGAKGLFLNETNKQVVGNITGSRLVKWFATGNNPLFVIVNTPRDFMWNILVSEHYSSIVPLAMAQMTYQLFPSTYDFIRTKLGRENTDMNLYLQHGGSMDYLHKQGDIADKSFADKYIVKTITSVFGKNNQPIVEDKIKNNYITKGVGALNEWSELAFRIATFRRSINAQLKEMSINSESEIGDLIDENGVVTQTRQEILDNIYRKATYDARSILDFSQGGRLIKDLEEFVPYLNVGVQATRSYADAMKKRPISTTLKTFQITTGGAAAFITLAMFMLSGDDDEPEEEKGKTVERKYVEFMQGVSEETRSKYYLIPTKQRDENGNRIAKKIAKDQFLIPYTNIVETLIENRIRSRAGFKDVSYDKISHRLYKDIFEYNLSSKTIKDVPLFKAGTAWYAGYDLYRNKPLDKYAKAEALEGIDNPQVEDFYKHLGAQWKVSPIRTKTAIEAIITSPQSNPYIATGYEVMDYAFTDKSMEHLGKGVKDMLLKGLKNRTTTKYTEWTRAENLLSNSKNEQLDAILKEEATRQLFKDKAQEVIDNKVTAEEVLQELESQYGGDPNYKSYIKSFRTTIKGELREEGTDGMMQRIKREKNPGAKAIMIREIYGDINSPENEEIKKELIGKRIINAATMRYLNKKTAN